MAETETHLLIRVCSGCNEQVRGSGHHIHGGKLAPLKEIEVVPHRAHEAEVESAAWRAIDIYLRSTAEASQSFPEYIESGDGSLTVPGGRDARAQIIANYAADNGLAFADVRCTRRYMRVDFDAIRDLAAEIAAADPADYGESPIAYTWDDNGWIWGDCEPNDPGSVAMYHLEEKPTPTQQRRVQ